MPVVVAFESTVASVFSKLQTIKAFLWFSLAGTAVHPLLSMIRPYLHVFICFFVRSPGRDRLWPLLVRFYLPRHLDNISFSLQEETKVLAKAAKAAKEAARPDPTVIAAHGTPGSEGGGKVPHRCRISGCHRMSMIKAEAALGTSWAWTRAQHTVQYCAWLWAWKIQGDCDVWTDVDVNWAICSKEPDLSIQTICRKLAYHIRKTFHTYHRLQDLVFAVRVSAS